MSFFNETTKSRRNFGNEHVWKYPNKYLRKNDQFVAYVYLKLFYHKKFKLFKVAKDNKRDQNRRLKVHL